MNSKPGTNVNFIWSMNDVDALVKCRSNPAILHRHPHRSWFMGPYEIDIFVEIPIDAHFP
jgi:hypothetical protein